MKNHSKHIRDSKHLVKEFFKTQEIFPSQFNNVIAKLSVNEKSILALTHGVSLVGCPRGYNFRTNAEEIARKLDMTTTQVHQVYNNTTKKLLSMPEVLSLTNDLKEYRKNASKS